MGGVGEGDEAHASGDGLARSGRLEELGFGGEFGEEREMRIGDVETGGEKGFVMHGFVEGDWGRIRDFCDGLVWQTGGGSGMESPDYSSTPRRPSPSMYSIYYFI